MKHEALELFSLKRIDFLFVAACPERRNAQTLRFAAREQRRSMGPRKHGHLARHGPEFLKPTPVRPFSLIQNERTHRFLLDRIKNFLYLFLLKLRFGRIKQAKHPLIQFLPFCNPLFLCL